MPDGGSSEVLFVGNGTALPNQFGGTDLYYLKGDHWFVRRTKTKPQAPDYVADESVEFYGNKDGFYAVASSISASLTTTSRTSLASRLHFCASA
jgi:hypothetical protein